MAADLARRVGGYFGPPPRGRPRLVATAEVLQLILTRNAHEAAVLERNLIRRWRPRYNRALPDEAAGFWHLQRLTTADGRFPTFQRYRPDGDAPVPTSLRDAVFGPYVSYAAAEAILGYMTDRFRLRTCSVHGLTRCIRFDMGACTPICDTPTLEEEHARLYREATRFLQQPDPSAADDVRALMGQAAERGDFAAAARLRDRAQLLERSLQPQASDVAGGGDCDVIIDGIVMVVRSGRVEDVRRSGTAEADRAGLSRKQGMEPTEGQWQLARRNARHAELLELA